MNHFLIGHADKTERLLQIAQGGFLLIDDGSMTDAFLEEFPRAVRFDLDEHSFNPLKNMDYKCARDFAALLYGLSPQGNSTLTARNGRRALVQLLLGDAKRLDHLPRGKDPADLEALGMVDELLVSPVVRNILCRPTNFSFKPTRQIVARIDPAELGDFDAVVIAGLLIGQFQGQVIVPDFGFYGREFHVSLIRQNRLIAGLKALSEVSPTLKQAFLGVKDKTMHGVLYKDAVELAENAGLRPDFLRDDNAYNSFLDEAMDDSTLELPLS
jgi:hypothetical protein